MPYCIFEVIGSEIVNKKIDGLADYVEEYHLTLQFKSHLSIFMEEVLRKRKEEQ